MGVVSEGADPDRLRDVSGRLGADADRLDQVGEDGSALLGVLVENWTGPDLEHFSASWPGARQAIAQATETLRSMSGQLERDAADQERASEAGGGGAGAGSSSRPSSGGPGPGGGYASGDPHWTEPDDEVYGELDPEIEAAWDEMTPEEQDAVLDAIIREQAARYGIDPPDITYDSSMSSNEFGVWRDGPRELVLNPDLLDDPQMAINTIVHEMRHAGQHEMIRDANPSLIERILGTDPEYIDGEGSPEDVEAWDENFDDYQSEDNGDTFEEYWEQPVEVDARQAGRDYVDDLTPEDLEDLVEDAESQPEPSDGPTQAPGEPGPPGTEPEEPEPSPSPGPAPTPSPTS